MTHADCTPCPAPEPSTAQAAPPPDWRAQPAAFLRALLDVAVARAQPLRGHLPQPPKGRTVVVGAGKAAAAMAHAVEQLWPPAAPLAGVVVTRYGHVPPRPVGLAPRIAVREAAHPVPDAAGVAASHAILQAVQGLTADDLVLCLISGGGSALLALPPAGMDLAQLQRISTQLLHSGADIAQMNEVRKHLSRIQGGRLALECQPAQLLTLAISDVPGDALSVIASGPTVPDASTCSDALDIAMRLRLDIPEPVLAQWRGGALESPKPGDACFARSRSALVATPAQALQAAALVAERAGLAVQVLGDAIEGPAREVAAAHAAIARAAQGPCLLLSGGETTVQVESADAGQGPRGVGGRAGEFGLGLLQALQGDARVWALAADTDGIDGMGEAAGVWLGPHTWAQAQQLPRTLEDYAQHHDSHGLFGALGSLVHTGPTHTNVNDFRAILVQG